MTDELSRCCVCGKSIPQDAVWTKKSTGDTFHRLCYLEMIGS